MMQGHENEECRYLHSKLYPVNNLDIIDYNEIRGKIQSEETISQGDRFKAQQVNKFPTRFYLVEEKWEIQRCVKKQHEPYKRYGETGIRSEESEGDKGSIDSHLNNLKGNKEETSSNKQ
ncbi:hypothetical protein HAX54_045042 [Datura stramonium]|uniref:Uncharacterized protein n=1 Tax=Datura stramonium TaxID=4076 RepID=A0ABS8WFC7_DATST|nr:hypothetical protein [Datura stramonium]